jgi:hypothetical protein
MPIPEVLPFIVTARVYLSGKAPRPSGSMRSWFSPRRCIIEIRSRGSDESRQSRYNKKNREETGGEDEVAEPSCKWRSGDIVGADD